MKTVSETHPKLDENFWKNRRVFLSGHTGFKGTWLSLWLSKMGALVTGYALEPPTTPSLFELCNMQDLVHSIIGDVRDFNAICKAMEIAAPDIVIHMAAQPLVLDSYRMPVETYATNVMGTVHVLDSVRLCKAIKAVINVTSDKCYQNLEWVWGYRENDPLGGCDPYSNSKGCSELITSAYRSSFFKDSLGVATVRSGNVIGGGDWARDRLIPDCIRSFLNNEPVHIRNPHAIRPWQHVLEPLFGYLILAERLVRDGAEFSGPWNFGPEDRDVRKVEWVVAKLCETWGNGRFIIDASPYPHEATLLKLDCSKAKTYLGWRPRWHLEKAIQAVIEWTKAYRDGKDVRRICIDQIEQYESTCIAEHDETEK